MTSEGQEHNFSRSHWILLGWWLQLSQYRHVWHSSASHTSDILAVHKPSRKLDHALNYTLKQDRILSIIQCKDFSIWLEWKLSHHARIYPWQNAHGHPHSENLKWRVHDLMHYVEAKCTTPLYLFFEFMFSKLHGHVSGMLHLSQCLFSSFCELSKGTRVTTALKNLTVGVKILCRSFK